MDYYFDPTFPTSATQSNAYLGLVSDEQIEEHEEFLRVLEEFDALQESEEERAARKASEEKAAKERRDKQKRITELQVLIAQLRTKVSAGGGFDKAVASQISMAQTELFWLQMS